MSQLNGTDGLFLAFALTWLEPAAAQDPPAPPALAVDDKIKQFRAAIAEPKHERDQEAIALIDGFTSGYETMPPKDQAAVRKALEECLTSPRVRRDPEVKAIFNAAAFSLGTMGAEGGKVLVRAYAADKYKPERDWLELRAVFIKNIGKTKDIAQAKFLSDRAADDPDDIILRAAGEALGNYADADMKVRKEIVKELVKKFNEIYGQAKQSLDPGDPIVERAKATLAAISRDWNETLKKLTGQDFSSPPDWQHFYNKNKDKVWTKA